MSGYSTSAPKNKLQQTLHDTNRIASEPSDEQLRISYGVIVAVNPETNQVRVKFLKTDGEIGGLVADGYLPLATSLDDIYLRFGALREGLAVRIYWRGKLNPKDVIIEVIGDEGHSFLSKTPYQNEIATGAWRIFHPTIF